jgi:hypothetical protein
MMVFAAALLLGWAELAAALLLGWAALAAALLLGWAALAAARQHGDPGAPTANHGSRPGADANREEARPARGRSTASAARSASQLSPVTRRLTWEWSRHTVPARGTRWAGTVADTVERNPAPPSEAGPPDGLGCLEDPGWRPKMSPSRAGRGRRPYRIGEERGRAAPRSDHP